MMILGLSLILSYSLAAQTGSIEVIVTSIDLDKGGEISAGIFEEVNFPEVGKQMVSIEKSVQATSMTFLFSNVPTGDYALAIFQDVNQDKDLETNFIGLPLEPIGFSNNVRIRFGPPSFDSAKVQVEPGQKTQLTVQLR